MVFLIIFGFNYVRQFLTLCIHMYPAGIWKDRRLFCDNSACSHIFVPFNLIQPVQILDGKIHEVGIQRYSCFWLYSLICMTLGESSSPDPDVKKEIRSVCPWEMLWIFLIVTQKKFSCETSLQYLFSQEFDMVSLLWNRWEGSNQLKMISL